MCVDVGLSLRGCAGVEEHGLVGEIKRHVATFLTTGWVLVT